MGISIFRGLAVALCLSVASSFPATAAEPAKVTLAFIGVTASNWPGLVAQEKGYFRDEGIDVDWLQTGQSSKSAQQVAAGVADIGSSSMVDTFRAIDGGGDLTIFANSLSQGIYSLVAKPSVHTIQDLKGQRVIVGGQKDITALWWDAAAKHFNMDPDKDVELLFAGSTSNRFAALMSGGVDAAVIGAPTNFNAIDKGFTDLGPIASYMGDFPMMIYHANTAWAAKNKDKLTAFVKAHNRAVRYMLDPKNKQEVAEILAKASNADVKDCLRTLDMAIAAHAFVPDGGITPAALEHVQSTLADSGDLQKPLKPLSAFYDPEYVEAAAK
jgi:NitT/TauT family transport system substrate-binding protein